MVVAGEIQRREERCSRALDVRPGTGKTVCSPWLYWSKQVQPRFKWQTQSTSKLEELQNHIAMSMHRDGKKISAIFSFCNPCGRGIKTVALRMQSFSYCKAYRGSSCYLGFPWPWPCKNSQACSPAVFYALFLWGSAGCFNPGWSNKCEAMWVIT